MNKEKKSKLTPELKLKHWGEGPWVNEKDIETFTHEGIECFIERKAGWDFLNNDYLWGGHLCGYVQIPKDNPLYGKELNSLDCDYNFEVHGGITMSEIINNKHWIGFDCAHSSDIKPALKKYQEELREEFKFLLEKQSTKPTYKDWDFVVNMTKSLAKQVKNYKEQDGN